MVGKIDSSFGEGRKHACLVEEERVDNITER